MPSAQQTLVAKLHGEHSEVWVFKTAMNETNGFWCYTESFTMNSADEEGMTRSTTDVSCDVGDVLPKGWILLSPLHIDQSLTEWFKLECPKKIAELADNYQDWFERNLRQSWNTSLESDGYFDHSPD